MPKGGKPCSARLLQGLEASAGAEHVPHLTGRRPVVGRRAADGRKSRRPPSPVAHFRGPREPRQQNGCRHSLGSDERTAIT